MRNRSSDWKRGAVPVGLIILIGALAFLPFAGRLGFYRDDWYMLWSGITRGADSIIELFSIDRPFMGYTYALTFRLLGSTPLPWQLYAYVLKTLSALAAYGIVRLVWPEQARAATAAALLFLIYPGFMGQPNAATLTNQLLSLTCGLSSIWLSGVALGTPRRGPRAALIIAAVFLGMVNFLLYEYMIGLEAMRFGVLWLVAQDRQGLPLRPRLLRLLKDSAPYLFATLAFLVWRLGFFQSERGGTDQFAVLASLTTGTRAFLVHVGLQSVVDVLETTLFAWAVPFQHYAALETSRRVATALVTGLALAVLAVAGMEWQRRLRPADDGGKDRTQFARLGLFAGVSMYAALFPVLVAGRDVNFDGGYDRYTLHASPAAAMLLAALAFGFLRGRGRPAFLGVLIFLGVSSTVLNAYHWERFWENQKQVWWQLWWRAPGLRDGTNLLVHLPEEAYFEDYEVWGPANLVYRRGVASIHIGAEVLNATSIAKMRAGRVEVRGMRKLAYTRDYNRSLLLSMRSEQSCLKVVDRQDLILPLAFPPNLGPVLRFSYLDQIELTAETAPPRSDIFGPEPPHTWCYYYQKAELAKQRGDWGSVKALADEVLALDLKPLDPVEWLPFVEGLLWSGERSAAIEMGKRMGGDPFLPREVCEALERGGFRFGDEIRAAMREAICNR
ncbi:MAG: hypothetical protein FJZ97_12045 [Chloroflexi bacterium]|nr:hypothetical protein [Chloroflexota bacterium]